MAKKKTTTPIEEIEVKQPKQSFVLQRDFDSAKYGKLKAGQSIELDNEQTITILKNNKYI